MTYYENRAVLRDNEFDIELCVRGGMEVDDVSGGYEITITTTDNTYKIRVSSEVWKLFCRQVSKL